MMRTRVAVVGVFAVSLAAVGCTSDDGGSGAGNNSEATEPASESADVTVIDYNVLHGLPLGNCPEETNFCKAETRLDMMWELVEEAGCPEIVALQELAELQRELIPPRLADVCDGRYSVVSELPGLVVEQWVLSSLPALDASSKPISGLQRSIQWVRLDSDLGPIDFYTTHFVAGIDNLPCSEGVCTPGITAGLCDATMEAGECDPLEALDFIDRTADDSALTILTGDLNAEIDEDRIVTLTETGFVDVWTLAGNDECDPDTGANCTSGQGGEGPYDGLDIAENTRESRIDFVLVRAPADCDLVVDGPDDGDGDGTATGIFAGEPFDPPVDGIFWPSDHSGVQADIACA